MNKFNTSENKSTKKEENRLLMRIQSRSLNIFSLKRLKWFKEKKLETLLWKEK